MDSRALALLLLSLALAFLIPSHFSEHRAYAATTKPKSISFYMYIAVQNITFLNNPASFTATLSAQPVQNLSYAFGEIHTFDNPLTTRSSLGSLHVGQVQGWYGNAGQSNLTLFLVQTFTLNTTRYNGTLSLLGVDVASDPVKYAPIVGGTGDFAFARGVATQTLISTAIIDDRTVSWFHYKLDLKY